MVLFSTASQAELYLGVGIGQSKYKDIDEVQAACAGVGAVCDVDDSGSAFKIYGGVSFIKFLGIEASYIDLGEAKANASVPIPAEATLTAKGGSLSLLPQIPIGDHVTVFGRLGVSAVEAELEASAPGFSAEDSTGAAGVIFGVGGILRLTDNIGIRAEWERHSFDEALELAGEEIDAPDIDMVSGSVFVAF